MTLNNIKEKIYALLDIDLSENAPFENVYKSIEAKLPAVVDMVGRKLASYTKSIKRSCSLTFTKDKRGAVAELPLDFCSLAYVEDGALAYGRECFEIFGASIYGIGIDAGEYTFVYYAYPAPVTSETEESTELYADAYFGDTVAYGTAAELCAEVYPNDIRRYMRLATEYDERLICIIGKSARPSCVYNGFFCARRGIV